MGVKDNFYKKANDKKTQNGGVAHRFYNNNNPQGNTTWFQKGTYEDGYQFGDLSVGIGGTVVDILGNVAQGVGNFGESVSDLGLYLGGGLADLFGFDSFAEENKKKAQKNTVNDFFDKYINPTTDKDSFLGEKIDTQMQNVGYVLPSVGVSVVAPHLGVGTVGVNALTTGGTFAASMGGGMSEAYNAGATDSEAWKYGFSSGLIEAGTELMFGGLAGGARTLGLTSGIGGLDDILANKLTSKFKSRVAKTLVKAGIKATGEGVEEVAAGYLSAIAKKHTYASEKELDELIEDENLLESFIGGAFVGGVFQVGNVASSFKTGRDIITGFTSREEAVVDALYNETVNNAKAKGQKLTKSDLAKIREQSEEAVRNGEVSVELIEKTLGGDAQKGLDALSAEADEFDKLYKTPGGELSREQQNRLDELEAKNKERSFEERKKEARQGLRQSVLDASAKDQYIGRAYVEEGKKYKAYSVNAKEYSGKGRAVVENAMKAGFLNDSSNTHKFVDLVAKLATEKGLEFDFTSNEKLKNSGFAIGGRVINGFVRGGKITVNMNAAKALNTVVGHEITHVLEGTQLYDELKTALFRYAQGKKDYDGRRKVLEELYKDVKGANVDAELMADLVGDYLFTDEAFIRRLSTENKNLFEKIFDEIKYLARLATAGSKEARELERVKKLFERVYKEADARKVDGDGMKLSISQNSYQAIDKYTQAQYNNFGWARDIEAITKQELDDVYTKLHEKGSLRKFSKSVYGESIVEVNENHYTNRDVNNVFVFIEGSVNSPKITRIARVDLFDEESIEYFRKAIYENNSNTAFEALAERMGNEIFQFYKRNDYADYGAYSRRIGTQRSGSESQRNTGFDRNGDQRSGTAKTVGENEIAPAKASSEDGVFFDGEKFSLSFDNKYSGKSYSEITEMQQELRQREINLAERKRQATNNAELVKAMDDYYDLLEEMRNLLPKRTKGTATEAELKRIDEIKALREEQTQYLKDLQEKLGLVEISNEEQEIRETMQALRLASDEAWEREGAERENLAIEKSGLTAPEYFRQKALKAFKTTTNYNEAGYMLPNGKLLNFSGGERNRRYRDHREIGEIYEVTNGTEALNRFLSDGNIRIMAESPGIDIASNVEPTSEQYTALRRFINTNGVKDGQFYVDFSDDKGHRIGSYAYDGRIIADKIINDIKYFYQTGEIREQSDIGRFLSLSKENASAPIAPLPGYNVRGEDITLKTAPLAKNTEEVANTKAAANGSAEGKNQPSASGGSLEINELRDEITNLRARLDEVKAQRDAKISGYQQTIDNKQEQYDSKANKDTKTASNLLASIERNTELRDKAAAKFDEQIRKLESELQDDIEQLMDKEETARLTHEPVTSEEKQRSFWSYVKELLFDKGMVFETLGKKHHNRFLESLWNQTRLAEPMAQHFIQNGVEGYDSINDVRKKLNAAGTSDDFESYMYHLHNSDRMRLAERAKVKAEDMKASDELLSQLTQIEGAKYADARALIEATREAVSMRPSDISTKTKELWKKYKEYNALLETKNKEVFGETVTAEISDAEAARLLSEHPEFAEYAEAIYANTKALRQMLVDSGVISQDAANLWDEMYPHYVPIKRDKTKGSAVSVPLDSRRTGVNVPVKKATGGNSDIGYLFSTLAERAEQTFSAVARNEFGKELRKVLALEGMTDLPGVLPEGTTGEGLDAVANLSDLDKTEGGEYSFTVFEGGQRKTFEVTEEMYDALKPRNKFFNTKIPLLGKISTWMRNVLTQYNPVFWMTNFIKDAQDVVWNSQHPGATYKIMMALMADAVATKGKKYFSGDAVKKYQSYIDEFAEHGGEGVTYFDRSTKAYVDEVSDLGHKALNAIVSINEAVERLPRLAEYIASREAGRSIEESMLDASRVTTNFQAGGDLTKWLNKNGFTFLNASVQGAVQSARNVREAYMEGAVKGTIVLAAKLAALGLPALILNALMWKDDEEYEQLSDYVKDNYYVIGKNDDGTFIRIPKGRMAAVISDLFEQVANGISGEGADFGNTAQLAISNLAPNNPIENNVLAPLIQAYGNTTWYGEDLIPSRLQNLPREEQYDESTDTISVLLGRSFVGKVLNLSPYQINYLLNQYSGGIGDFVIPMLTPEVESRTNWAIAPFADKFTTNANFNSQYVSDFYDTMDELTKAAQSMNATDEDKLRYKYFLSQNSKLSELYQQKREVQAVPSKELSDKEKYNAVYDIQEQINKITKEALDSYQDVVIDRKYATVGDVGYYWYEPSEDAESAEPGWHKISDKQLEKQDKVCSEFDISAAEYWNNREELSYAYDYPARYLVSQFSGGYETYRAHMKVINKIESDKDENGDSISGSRKKKVLAYILSAKDLNANEKMILYRSLYSDSQYNRAIVEYLAKRNDISYENKLKLLEALGFKVGANGVYW